MHSNCNMMPLRAGNTAHLPHDRRHHGGICLPRIRTVRFSLSLSSLPYQGWLKKVKSHNNLKKSFFFSFLFVLGLESTATTEISHTKMVTSSGNGSDNDNKFQFLLVHRVIVSAKMRAQMLAVGF